MCAKHARETLELDSEEDLVTVVVIPIVFEESIIIDARTISARTRDAEKSCDDWSVEPELTPSVIYIIKL